MVPDSTVDSQLISRPRRESALAKPLLERIGTTGRKVQAFDAVWVARDHELIAGQGLPTDDFAQVKGEVLSGERLPDLA